MAISIAPRATPVDYIVDEGEEPAHFQFFDDEPGYIDPSIKHEEHHEYTVGEAIRHLAQIANGDGEQFGLMIALASGMSLGEIGQMHGMTKQAVHKRIRRLPPVILDLIGTRGMASDVLQETAKMMPVYPPRVKGGRGKTRRNRST